jgi:hypothetical protein
VVLADTNILSTFAKIGALSLFMRLFAEEGIGVVPAVYEELHQGVSKGYVVLQAAIELVQRRHIELVVPNAEETLGKSALPPSFDAGERETIAVSQGKRRQGTDKREVGEELVPAGRYPILGFAWYPPRFVENSSAGHGQGDAALECTVRWGS